MDMKEISKAISEIHIPSSDIYKPTNDGKRFISIDMKKANFHSLKAFAPDIFDNADTWEDFMRKFTDDEHIIGSKYVRQRFMIETTSSKLNKIRILFRLLIV